MMKRLLILLLILCYPLNLFSKNADIGYVDLKYILKNSIPSKNLQKELDKGRNLFQQSINQEEIVDNIIKLYESSGDKS